MYVSILLSSLYSKIGQQELDLTDLKITQKTLINWIGFSTYLVIDSFASGLFANVLSNSSFIHVFKREYKSGLYTPSMYYFGTWLIKMIFLSFYPVLLFSFVFSFLDLKDDSR
jgi:hypothetical protein